MAVSTHSMALGTKMCLDALRGNKRGCTGVVGGSKDAVADQLLVKGKRLTAEDGFKRIVRKIDDVGTYKVAAFQRGTFTSGDHAAADRARERVGNIGLRGGAVTQSAEDEFRIHLHARA